MKPAIAVVGHPNQGKSSIVSTLTRLDTIAVSALSGTTTVSQAFTLGKSTDVSFEFFDTPGFQRPRQLLAQLSSQTVSAAERPTALKTFLEQTSVASGQPFFDEVQLLTPIMAGAGILYVVDGSVPYREEYEAEMEILRWTGQPRMALINPMGESPHLKEWQVALNQYFSVVRVFDPMDGDTAKQRAIFSAFAELHEPWRERLNRLVAQLQAHDEQQQLMGLNLIVDTVQQMLAHRVETTVPVGVPAEGFVAAQKVQYKQSLRQFEQQMFTALPKLFAHQTLSIESSELGVQQDDLFDDQRWALYGIDRKTLVGLSASAGAVAGAGLDVAVGGHSLMLGAALGGLGSAVASIWASAKPDRLKLKGLPIAGQQLRLGPVKDLNFAFVVLGRALAAYHSVVTKAHADRTPIVLESKASLLAQQLDNLSTRDRTTLARLLMKCRKGLSEADREAFQRLLAQLLGDL